MLFSDALKVDAIKKMTVEKLSPELISAQWKKDNIRGVSHETIYKFILLKSAHFRKLTLQFYSILPAPNCNDNWYAVCKKLCIAILQENIFVILFTQTIFF